MKKIYQNSTNKYLQRKVVIIILSGLLWTQVLSAKTHYYNGNQRVDIIQEKSILAEKVNIVASNIQPDSSFVKRVDRSSQLIKQQGGILLWRTNPVITKSRIVQRFQINDIDSRYLPVYKNGTGAIIIPTGNIMVYFLEDFSESQVKLWAIGRGLRLIEKLPLKTKNVWVIETPPGEKSIEIANSLIGDGPVETAMPNFWVDFSKK